jgi:hypothetical protein
MEKRIFTEQEKREITRLGKTEIRKIIHTMKQASELL